MSRLQYTPASQDAQKQSGYAADSRCPDCGAPEGALHNYFPVCNLEFCPFCLYPLGCCQHQYQPKTVKRKGRIPYFFFPLLCQRCGVQWPIFFNVPDREWKRVVPRNWWDEILCRPCYDVLKDVDNARIAAKQEGK